MAFTPLPSPPTPAPYPASLLINRAWNLSGIVAREFEQVSGQEGSDGLYLLNELLDYTAVDLRLIPYYQRIEFSLVQGQEVYFLPNVYEIETFTFNIGSVRFPTGYMSRKTFFGIGRVDNIQALPFSWHLERAEGGSNLYVYFLPEANYIAKMTCKVALTNVQLNTNMAGVNGYDGFYLSYLRYRLAAFQCLEYNIDFGAEKQKQLDKMEHSLANVSPPDLTLQKISILNDNAAFDWEHVNISPSYNVF